MNKKILIILNVGFNVHYVLMYLEHGVCVFTMAVLVNLGLILYMRTFEKAVCAYFKILKIFLYYTISVSIECI